MKVDLSRFHCLWVFLQDEAGVGCSTSRCFVEAAEYDTLHGKQSCLA